MRPRNRPSSEIGRVTAKARRASVELFTRLSFASSLGRAQHREKARPLLRLPERLTRRLFTSLRSIPLHSTPRSGAPSPRRQQGRGAALPPSAVRDASFRLHCAPLRENRRDRRRPSRHELWISRRRNWSRFAGANSLHTSCRAQSLPHLWPSVLRARPPVRPRRPVRHGPLRTTASPLRTPGQK